MDMQGCLYRKLLSYGFAYGVAEQTREWMAVTERFRKHRSKACPHSRLIPPPLAITTDLQIKIQDNALDKLDDS